MSKNHLASDFDGTLLAGDCLKNLFRELLHVMQSCEAGMRKNADPDYLHDFRVATRKSRTLLTMVSSVFPKQTVDRYASGFAWLLKATSPTRDLHVYLEKLPDHVHHLPADKVAGLELLHDYLQEKLVQEHQSLLAQLESKRYHNLMKSWQLFLDEPVSNNARMTNARRPVKDVADKALKRAFRKLAKRGDTIRTSNKVSALHKFRISCKRFRYLLALFKHLYHEKNVTPVIKLLKNIQETLGDYHDLQVEIDILKEFEVQLCDKEALLEASMDANNELLDYMTQQQLIKLEHFQQIYKELGSKQSRARFKSIL